jgi:hypothetical protein
VEGHDGGAACSLMQAVTLAYSVIQGLDSSSLWTTWKACGIHDYLHEVDLAKSGTRRVVTQDVDAIDLIVLETTRY